MHEAKDIEEKRNEDITRTKLSIRLITQEKTDRLKEDLLAWQKRLDRGKRSI